MKDIIIEPFICKIGNNSAENWTLLDNSKDHHIFFHLSHFPSCYEILESEIDKEVDIQIIKQAALQCKLHTKYKNLKNIRVDYTIISNVVKGEKVGEIFYKSNRKVKNLLV